MITKVLSCGMSGVERAALDAARERCLPMGWGGFSLKGHLVDDGSLPEEYVAPRFSRRGLIETELTSTADLLERCALESSGVLILRSGAHSHHTKMAIRTLKNLSFKGHSRPYFVADPWMMWHIKKLMPWLARHRIRHIMITGPTLQERGLIYEKSLNFIREILSLDYVQEHWGVDLTQPKSHYGTSHDQS